MSTAKLMKKLKEIKVERKRKEKAGEPVAVWNMIAQMQAVLEEFKEEGYDTKAMFEVRRKL